MAFCEKTNVGELPEHRRRIARAPSANCQSTLFIAKHLFINDINKPKAETFASRTFGLNVVQVFSFYRVKEMPLGVAPFFSSVNDLMSCSF